jgi:5'-hydroxyaverantin dehydrogenase
MTSSTDAQGIEQLQKEQRKLFQGTAKIKFDKQIDYSNVRGKTFIVTGGGSGIGRALASELSSLGAHVAILDVSVPSKASDQHREGSTGRAISFSCDVSSWESLSSAFRQALLWSSNRLDGVVICAGVRSHKISELILDLNGGLPKEPPTSVIDVNLSGSYYTAYLTLWYYTHSRASAAPIDPACKPQLLFVGSLAGYAEHPLSADYCASKHGVRGLWKSLRAHGNVFGNCQMNMLVPTFVDNRPGSNKERGNGNISLFKLADVADVIAGALRCLCDAEIDGLYLNGINSSDSR